MELRELPNVWTAVTLETVAEVYDNLREPVNSAERKKRTGSFPYYGATGQVGWIDDFRQDGEYVLLGEDGAPFFDPTKVKAYLVSGKCWVNNHAHVLKGREGVCLNRYLLYALNQVNYRGFANGTTRLKLTQAAMRQLPINLAPLAEQHRIVAKIEELFSELDQGVASLKTAREQLKVYRQSLLKNAFAGKLTAAWRAAHADQLETAAALQQRIARERAARYQQQLADWQTAGQPGAKPNPPKPLPPLTAEELAELPELPAGWGWVKLADVSNVSGGLTKNQKRELLSGTRPYLRVANVYANRLELDEIHNIGVTDSELERVVLEKGDLLIVEGNGSIDQIGRVALWAGQISGCVHQNHIIKARPLKLAAPKFLLYFLMSEIGRKFIVRAASSTSGLHTLSISKVEGLFVPLCSGNEQAEVVAELESKLSEADQLDQTLATALQQAEALRQSILKKGFCGQLVKQDKNDEPASALLERIRAENANGIKKPRRKAKIG